MPASHHPEDPPEVSPVQVREVEAVMKDRGTR